MYQYIKILRQWNHEHFPDLSMFCHIIFESSDRGLVESLDLYTTLRVVLCSFYRFEAKFFVEFEKYFGS